MEAQSKPESAFSEASAFVQAHLNIVQRGIQGIVSHSASWCITIASAILVVLSGKEKPESAWLALPFPGVVVSCLGNVCFAIAFPLFIFCWCTDNYLACSSLFPIHGANAIEKSRFDLIQDGGVGGPLVAQRNKSLNLFRIV